MNFNSPGYQGRTLSGRLGYVSLYIYYYITILLYDYDYIVSYNKYYKVETIALNFQN